VSDFWDFDHIYTGPIHGFKSAMDYYNRNSAKYFVHDINIPTLIVNAKNDPLVPYESLPIDVIEKMPNVILELTEQGGHCGFRPCQVQTNGAYWSEQRALAFLG
jgi:predicted alpha/beta-fold hydrolase